MARHALARQAESVSQSGPAVVNNRRRQMRHPEIAALLVFVDQPHAAGVALALFDQRLDERAEEAFDVGFAHEQIERELDHSVWIFARHSARRRSLRFSTPALAAPAGSPESITRARCRRSRSRQPRAVCGLRPLEHSSSRPIIDKPGTNTKWTHGRGGLVQKSSDRPRPGACRVCSSREADLRPLPDCGGVLAVSAHWGHERQFLLRISAPASRAGDRAPAPLRSPFTVVSPLRCSTAAQPGAPPSPQVAVANVIDREITEWDKFAGRLEAVDSVEVRPRVSG